MECACAVPSTDAASADSGIATVTVLLRSAAPTFFFPIFHKNLPHGTTTSLPSRKIGEFMRYVFYVSWYSLCIKVNCVMSVVTKVTASFHSVDEDVARESALNVSRTKHHDAD